MTPAQLDQSTTALYFDNACPWISAVLTSKPRIKSPTHTESRGNGQPGGFLDVGDI